MGRVIVNVESLASQPIDSGKIDAVVSSCTPHSTKSDHDDIVRFCHLMTTEPRNISSNLAKSSGFSAGAPLRDFTWSPSNMSLPATSRETSQNSSSQA